MPKKKAVAKPAPEPKPEVQPEAKSSSTIETFEITEEPQEIDIKTAEHHKPSPLDKNWTEYVLDQLYDDEKFEDKPKSEGLRRLVEKFLGEIIDIDTEIVQAPNYDSDKISTATVKSIIEVLTPEGKILSCSGVADASNLTCVAPFDRFLTSIAETRAEGRAFRKLLRLKNVITSDEISQVDSPELDLINTAQINRIDSLCQKLDISVKELMIKGTGQEKRVIGKYNKEEAITVMEKLQNVQNGKTQVPEQIKGYDSEWRDYFE